MSQNEKNNILKGKSKEEVLSKLVNLSQEQLNDSMIQASRNGLTSTIKLLLDYKIPININCRDSSRYTPLMFACIRGNYQMAELLIMNGANVNLKNRYGTTALMSASFYGRSKIVDLLLKAGAKTDVTDRAHELPLDYCLRGLRHKHELGTYRNKTTATSEHYNEIITLLTTE